MTGEVFALAFPTPWEFWSEGLELDAEGRLSLAALPVWPELSGASSAPSGGLAVDGGRAYFTCQDTILVQECDGSRTCFGFVGSGAGLGSVRDPKGLAVTKDRTLLVADRGNDRVLEFDLATAQMVWAWQGIRQPNDVAAEDDGGVLVAATDGVHRLHRSGDRSVLAPSGELGGRPNSLAIGIVGHDPVLFVSVGTSRPSIHAIPMGPAGDTANLIDVLERVLGSPGAEPHPPAPLAGPISLRTHGDRLYVGSRTTGAIRVVNTALPSLLGDLPGQASQFSALALDAAGTLWISDCDGAVTSKHTSPTSSGQAEIGPIPLRLDPGASHSLRVRTAGRWHPGGATVAVSFLRSPNDELIGATPDLFLEIPRGATEVTVHLQLMESPSGSVPVHSQYVNLVELRVDEPGWIEDLPAIYRAQGDPSAFLDPYLRLLRTGNDALESMLLDLPSQFDPATAVDDLDGDRWLDWLASWVDVDLDERWDGATRRSIVGNAFHRHGGRGTRAALEEMIGVELDLQVSITEPGETVDLWLLGDDGAELGIATMTAAGPSNGSLVDVTAVADRSHLIGPSDYGAPLFGDVAHRFDVRVHASQINCEEDRKRLRALIEREKPAHTTAHLCVTEPGISVGIQSRVGVDAVIGVADDPRSLGGLEGFHRDRAGGHVALGDEGPLVLN